MAVGKMMAMAVANCLYLMQMPHTAEQGDAYCWICHSEVADDLGQPPRRDCLCRGSYSGFLHLSCLVEYAEQKSLQYGMNRKVSTLVDPWRHYPSYKQPYQNQPAIDPVNKYVVFVETHYPGNQMLQLDALRSQKLVLHS